MPSLCSIDDAPEVVARAERAVGATRYLGTRNSEMPRVPAGAPGVRARTRWTMLSARSCSPQVMKILVPVDPVLAGVPPSAIGVAVVRSAPTSLPACGSVRFIVAGHSPLTSFGR